jgi:hypothetical protein
VRLHLNCAAFSPSVGPTSEPRLECGSVLEPLSPFRGWSLLSTIVNSGFDILRHTSSPYLPFPIDSTVCYGAAVMSYGKRIAIPRFGTSLNMFKISIDDTPSRRMLIVEGTLVGPWIAELGKSWRDASQDLDRRKLVIHLKNLTAISHEGEDAIFDLMKKGAKFTSGSVLTSHVLKQLLRKKQQESQRR